MIEGNEANYNVRQRYEMMVADSLSLINVFVSSSDASTFDKQDQVDDN